MLSYGHLKFFTLWPDNGHRRPYVILYSVQCCYAVHWTDKNKSGTFSWPKCISHVFCYNVAGVGLQWSNINKVSSVDDNFTMLHTLIMLAVDIILYTLITWYFDAVLPGDFGTPQPFYFPFTVFFTGVIDAIAHCIIQI